MRTGTCVVLRYLLRAALIGAPGLIHGQTLTLQQAIESAEANNRAIRAARLEHAKAEVPKTRPVAELRTERRVNGGLPPELAYSRWVEIVAGK